ncbi:Response regulator receiver domain-containing protein, partial [Streptomyces sp. DvalAA-43]
PRARRAAAARSVARPCRRRAFRPRGRCPVPPGGHRARQGGENQLALPSAPAPAAGPEGPGDGAAPGSPQAAQPTGRRARRALSAGQERTDRAEPAGPRTAFALPPAEADRSPAPAAEPDASLPGRHDAVRVAPGDDHTPPQAHPVPTGRRRARHAEAAQQPGRPEAPAVPGEGAEEPPGDGAERSTAGGTTHATGTTAVAGSPESTEEHPQSLAPVPDSRRQPLPAEAPVPGDASDSTQGRAFSVRTLGQGVPFAQHIAHQQNQTLGGAGRRRKLAAPPEDERTPSPPSPAVPGQLRSAPEAEGRAYAIGAPDEGAEGPEPLDGPGGAVEVANRPSPRPVDDELPPEPLDNPRRLLVWPAPDVSTQQALSDRGYRPVIVHSREEVDAQIAAFPAALFVDPLTGPITRKALQSLRQAAVAAEVPVLVTAGLGQASREAAYGADPAVLLKALAPRDSEQHPPRVLLIEEHEEIALALTETLERRGMQVARAATDSEAVSLATRTRPNLVVMDLMQVRRRRAGIIDWLRANGQLNRTPLVVYTSAGMSGAELPKLGSGETVLFLAERSTSEEVQSRIVDLLAKIGTN